jgi:apolipoprotein N-acyltransferase
MKALSAWVWVPASATLLILAYPLFNQPWCAWVALIPWLLGLRGRRLSAAFGLSFLVGLFFFLGSLPWLIYVTALGWVLLSLVLASFFGVFGALAAWGTSRSPQQTAARWLGLPALWVALEYTRSHLFSGFGWNPLGYSQTPWLPVIQVADVTGAWGVSFALVLANLLFAEALAGPSSSVRRLRAGLLGVLLAGGLWGYGAWRLHAVQAASLLAPRVRVAVVQGNIPQKEKWDDSYRDVILRRYEQWTREAAATHPQLIVWPETSVPDYLWLDEEVTQRMIALAREGQIPLLVGAPMGTLEQGAWRTTNSAALLDPQGVLTQHYDKLRLVPFGEFVPAEPLLPWVREMLPTIGYFAPGRDFTVFRAQGLPAFSVLICFEDIFANLARAFVRQGAQFLLVITNDAWFGPTGAAYQHAQASLLRSVELRVPVARAGNTGWSGCLSATGETLGVVRDAQGKELFVPGTVTCDLPLPAVWSLYRLWGDWWAYLCLLISCLWLGWLKRRS